MFWRRRRSEARIAAGPENRRLYVVGDIHGCLHLLKPLRDAILDDCIGCPGTAHTIFLGDYVDRGPDSAGVVELLVNGGFPDPVFLKGNHEAMLLAFLDDPADGEVWRRNGAVETLTSYGVDVRQVMLGRDLDAAAEALAANLPASHRDFFSGLRLWHREGDYFFCHAGIRPGVPLDEQAEADLIWIREEFLASRRDHGAVVVHGHTPVAAPEVLPNRINLDTGAFLSERLTCLVIEGEKRRFLQSTARGVSAVEAPGG